MKILAALFFDLFLVQYNTFAFWLQKPGYWVLYDNHFEQYGAPQP